MPAWRGVGGLAVCHILGLPLCLFRSSGAVGVNFGVENGPEFQHAYYYFRCFFGIQGTSKLYSLLLLGKRVID